MKENTTNSLVQEEVQGKEFVRFFDLQTGDYSHHNTIQGLYEFICEGYCECGEGHDKFDEKDGKMKCLNCWRLNNLDKISKEEMIEEIKSHGYRIETFILNTKKILSVLEPMVVELKESIKNESIFCIESLHDTLFQLEQEEELDEQSSNIICSALDELKSSYKDNDFDCANNAYTELNSLIEILKK